MNRLTQRALRVYSVLEDYRAGSADILDALLPFFEPFLADRTGTIVSPASLAEEISKAYKWNLTADVVEEISTRFEAKGWITRITETDEAVVYKVIHNGKQPDDISKPNTNVADLLATVAEEFQNFITSISPLTTLHYSREQLAETLVEWLVSIDAYSEDVLRQQLTKTLQTDGRISLFVDLPDVSLLGAEEKYLCARFLKYLFETHSVHIAGLCRIAAVGLLTEVVQDFRKPTTSINTTDLSLYLDAPVAMDLLGVSGKAARTNIRPIIEQLQSIGASVRIYRLSVREMQGALNAVLSRRPADRTGPTAGALRKGEALEAYVRQVATTPETILQEHGVQIVERTLEQYPNQHVYFTNEQYQELYARINWHLEVPPREHDAKVTTLILRARGEAHSQDLFRVKHVLITRNALLSQLTRRFCVDFNVISRNEVGPVIHQRQLATAVWLRTGLANKNEDVPRQYVLAACERVLELKRSVIDKVRSEAKNLTQEKADQLELLLTQDRSIQVLADKTLNVSNLVDASNIDQLVETMRRSLLSEIEADKRQEVREIRGAAQTKVAEAQRVQQSALDDAAAARALLDRRDAEDEEIVDVLLSDANRLVDRDRTKVKLFIVAVVLGIGALPLASETLTGATKTFFLLIAGGAAAAAMYFQIWDRSVGLRDLLERRAQRLITSLAKQRGIETKLRHLNVVYSSSRPAFRKDRERKKEASPSRKSLLD